MTTLVDRMEEYYASVGRAPCASGRKYIPPGRTAAEIYNGKNRPDMWLIVLAVVNPRVAASTAVTLLQGMKDVAGGEFKADLMSLRGASRDHTARLTRVKKRDRRSRGAGCTLENGYMSLLEFLRTRDPRALQGVGQALVECDVRCNGVTMDEARTALFAALRAKVDEATFKGEYT